MAEIFWELPSGQVQSIEFDCTERDAHDSSATITEHSMEEGADASDHVRPNLDRVTLDVVVSNQPIKVPKTQVPGLTGGVRGIEFEREGIVFAKAQALVFDEEFDRVRSVYEELLGLKNRGQLCTVITSLREYENMVIERIGTIREAPTGHALVATVEAREMRIVRTEVVETELPRATRRADRGRENPTDADATTEGRSQSLAFGLRAYIREVAGLNDPSPPPPPPPGL